MAVTAASHEAIEDWIWTQSPDPANPIFTLFVKTKLITLTNKPKRESNLGVLPYVPATLFKELAPEFNASHLNAMGISDWSFIGENIEGSRTAFHFFKTQAKNNILATPYETNEEIGNHYWHPIVLEVWTEEDNSFPQSTNFVEPSTGRIGIVSGPSFQIRDKMIAEIEEGTTFVTRKYLSALRPPFKRSSIPQPQPMLVRANGTSREYSKVLHPRIVVQATPSGVKTVLGTSGTSGLGGGTDEQIFEATNHTERKPYILSFKSVRNAFGLWETVEIEVRPPKTETILIR